MKRASKMKFCNEKKGTEFGYFIYALVLAFRDGRAYEEYSANAIAYTYPDETW